MFQGSSQRFGFRAGGQTLEPVVLMPGDSLQVALDSYLRNTRADKCPSSRNVLGLFCFLVIKRKISKLCSKEFNLVQREVWLAPLALRR